MSYRAHIEYDVMTDVIRLYLVRPTGDYRSDVLMADGSWSRAEAGARPAGEVGFPLPADSLPEIAKALTEHLGNALPSQAEVSVLREWLAVEQRRVDDVLRPSLSQEEQA